MPLHRARFSSLPQIAFHPTRFILITTATVMLAALAALPATGASRTAYAGTVQAPSTARQLAPTRFLTLPFEPDATMSVLSGWYYSSSGGFHGGIDYIKGNVNNVRGWQTFAVIAAADGEACGNCTSRQGNAVWVKHNVNGVTYYTYYGHLAWIAPGIPIGSQSRTVHVRRGQFLGWAGDTGARGALHLHFALYNAASQPIDPYGIGKLRQYYPRPTDATPGIGWFLGD